MTDYIVDIETTGLSPMPVPATVRKPAEEETEIIMIGVLETSTAPKDLEHELDSGVLTNHGKKEDNEALLLQDFWNIVSVAKKIILFNGDAFDWQFLKLRSLKHGIKMKHFRKYEERIDLRLILNPDRYKKGTTLDDYCAFLGIENKDKIASGDIPELWRKGKREECIEHLKHDLKKTLQLYNILRNCGLLR